MREAFCLASGPSLTADDVARVRAWRGADPERWVAAVNTTYQLAPWADALYAMDRVWWNIHKAEILRTFPGKRYSSARQDGALDVTVMKRPDFEHFSNSGAGAVSLAAKLGARRVYLLGYDCKVSASGKRHWHGDHPKPLGNSASLSRWHIYFERLARYCRQKQVAVLNCSRDTALKVFPCAALDDILLSEAA